MSSVCLNWDRAAFDMSFVTTSPASLSSMLPFSIVLFFREVGGKGESEEGGGRLFMYLCEPSCSPDLSHYIPLLLRIKSGYPTHLCRIKSGLDTPFE